MLMKMCSRILRDHHIMTSALLYQEIHQHIKHIIRNHGVIHVMDAIISRIEIATFMPSKKE